LKYNLGQTENKSNLPAMSGCTMLRYLQPQVVGYYSESMG